MLNSEAAQSVMSDEYRSGFYRPEGFFDGLSLPDYGGRNARHEGGLRLRLLPRARS